MSGKSELPVPPTSKPPVDGPKTQWIKQVVNAAGAAHKFEKPIVARRAVQEGTDRLRANGRNGSEAKYKQNQPPELEFKLNPHLTGCSQFHADSSTQIQEDSDHEVLKITHKALYERLNMYGFVFVLLGSISFVAILQPPGGFDNDGHMRSNTLVSCFMFFSTLSFLFTFIGLFGVVVGFLTLFRPAFYLKFEIRASSAKFSQSGSSQVLKSLPSSDISGSSHNNSLSSDRSRSLLYNASPGGLHNKEGMDDLTVMAKLLWDNLERMWRLRIYLIFSLVLIVSAFGCGVFAIIGGSNRSTYLLAGAIIVGVVTLVFEVFRTVHGIHTYHKSKWLKLLQNHAPDADLPSETHTPVQKFMDWFEVHVHSPSRSGSGSARPPRGPSKLSTSSGLGASNNV
ncbi:hypothetical protein KC19_8G135900 [Ceratodon purpureus]|uniref:PGG domain-containing protein n=1 Tax=Ceratodon purpureus TaxID=3225 RepID=A0A8T0H0V0_CERPU|nr:hypothetical protein KC19_8G135900 [Ceratodon purpureus]